MKPPLIPSLVIAALAAGILCQPASAEEPDRGSVAHGILSLPLDFYPDHREALGLNEDQMRAMQRIVGEMHGPAEKIEREMRDRTRALHEAVGQNPIEPKRVMERFEQVLRAENEMKMLQFRTRIAMRSVLTPEQYAKVPALAKKESAARGGAGAGELHERMQQLRQEIARRSGGGEPPRELVERLEQIEHAARQGRAEEAKEQLEATLRHLRSEGGESRGAEIEQRMRKVAEEMERSTDPEQRERFEKELRKMREMQEKSRSESNGRSRADSERLEKRMHQIAEAAERTDNPEARERLQGALRKLKEASQAGNRDAIEDILKAIEPVLRDSGRPQQR